MASPRGGSWSRTEVPRGLRFVPAASEACTRWQGQDRKTLRRTNTLTEAALREPFVGIGRPEPLVGNLAGCWSRRIGGGHRLVYRATEAELVVVACRFRHDD
jgi:toxin YoeB